MAYNSNNHKKRVRHIMEIYQQHKHHDVPDTKILKNVFAKCGIFISYRQWMNYKNMRMRDLQPVNENQLQLFG